ncbi:hypothetical protein H8959_012200 [Pygathrix nigripes]
MLRPRKQETKEEDAGIPCEGGLRCLCWKILLNYLPLERASWTSILAKQRELYAQFLREMIIQPGIAKANMGVSREDVTFEDHPLNPNPDSRWNTYFKDNEVLLQIDKDVSKSRTSSPSSFAFRWLTLLLSQEFLLPDVIRIWDSLFADDNRFDFLLLVCCAMLMLIREQLLEGDFTVNMRLLQDYPITDVCQILQKAKELQDSK